MRGSLARSAARALRREDGDRGETAGGRPVLLLHGFLSSSRVLLPLERHIRRTLRRPVVRVGLGRRVPLHLQDVRKSARRVHATLDALARRPGFEFADVVGHSLGGIVATYVLKRLDGGRRIRRVVTLGSPHRGTPLALPGVLLFGAFSRAVWQMIPGSPLLRELAALPVPSGAEVVAVASPNDGLVPERSARLCEACGQSSLTAPPTSHMDLLFAPAVLGLVARVLAG